MHISQIRKHKCFRDSVYSYAILNTMPKTYTEYKAVEWLLVFLTTCNLRLLQTLDWNGCLRWLVNLWLYIDALSLSTKNHNCNLFRVCERNYMILPENLFVLLIATLFWISASLRYVSSMSKSPLNSLVNQRKALGGTELITSPLKSRIYIYILIRQYLSTHHTLWAAYLEYDTCTHYSGNQCDF